MAVGWPTPTDLGNYLGQSITDPVDIAHAQASLDNAKAAVQAEARQTIEAVANDSQVLRGNWTNKLWLPQIPVTGISFMSITHGSVFVSDVNLVVNSDFLWDRMGLVSRVSYITGRLLFPASGHWGGERASINVTYSHGWADIPEYIRQIVLGAASRVYTNPRGVLREDVSMGTVRVMTMYGRTTVVELTDGERRQLKSLRDHAYRALNP